MEWLKNLATRIVAFFRKYWVIIVGKGIYAILSWIYDNPLWWFAELKWGKGGVAVMVVAAIAINFCILLYYRRKKVAWLGWDEGFRVLKEKENWLEENFGLVSVFISILISGVFLEAESAWVVFPIFVISIALVKSILLFVRVKSFENVVAFFVLSIFEDSFITTAYLRRNRLNGIGLKDGIIFLASSIISTGYWAVRNGLVIEIIIRPLAGM